MILPIGWVCTFGCCRRWWWWWWWSSSKTPVDAPIRPSVIVIVVAVGLTPVIGIGWVVWRPSSTVGTIVGTDWARCGLLLYIVIPIRLLIRANVVVIIVIVTVVSTATAKNTWTTIILTIIWIAIWFAIGPAINITNHVVVAITADSFGMEKLEWQFDSPTFADTTGTSHSFDAGNGNMHSTNVAIIGTFCNGTPIEIFSATGLVSTTTNSTPPWNKWHKDNKQVLLNFI